MLAKEMPMVSVKEVYEVGEIPPIGEVPPLMYAQGIRPGRFGEPIKAFQIEKVETPAELKPREALVLVMAAGINYSNVWAARGVPVTVIKAREREGDTTGFHIGGSDASGIVYKVGSDVTNIKVGDRVVIHCGMWDEDSPFVKAGNDPMFDQSFKIWGYETNWGSFAQFTKVQAHQCMPKAAHLTWEEAAAPTLVGATAYRMLYGWPPNVVEEGDPVLVWGGAGGLGSMAVQIVRETGGKAVICAGTTGYNAVVDLRYLWMRQKRFQGSHFANDEQSLAFNQLVVDGKIDPCLSEVFSFEDIGNAHQLMSENKHPEGNMAALVSAPPG